MTKPVASYDVLIVGAGPAGATAAMMLASKHRRVALFEAARFPRKAVCAGWLGTAALPLFESLGVTLDDAVAHPFETVTFYNSDLTRSAVPAFEQVPGYLIDRSRLDARLASAAVDAGAAFQDAHCVSDIALGESLVTLSFENAAPVTGNLLILAAGRGTPLLDRLRLTPGSIPKGWWAAQVEVERVHAAEQPVVSIVLGLDDAGGFGIVVVADGRATLGVQTPGDRSTVVSAVTALCRNAVEHGLIGVEAGAPFQALLRDAARCTPVMTPAAVALAMDTHVAKRTLIVGDAGGFVSATSGEGIYPAMWSARIAAGVVDDALNSASPQDVLMEFNTRWRTEMADYLRPPNTDAQYIFPLVFSNQPVADRMGAAFFSGENM